MGPLLVLLAIVGAFVLWCFFIFPPDYAQKKQITAFNWSVTAITLMVCLGWMLKVNILFAAAGAGEYTPLFSYGGALAIEIVLIGFFFLIRNFWIFRPRRRPGDFF